MKISTRVGQVPKMNLAIVPGGNYTSQASGGVRQSEPQFHHANRKNSFQRKCSEVLLYYYTRFSQKVYTSSPMQANFSMDDGKLT
ncbi:unnamed protein product [Brugia pahangi]|uniref:Ovule protein n=1 Tax=Brugia pahangi TaxID=6280 RepID=A0A0N4T5L9_BRUPA|nr:unnamed protein product [Brugia pahangi]